MCFSISSLITSVILLKLLMEQNDETLLEVSTSPLGLWAIGCSVFLVIETIRKIIKHKNGQIFEEPFE